MVRVEIENKLSKTIKNEKYFTFLLTFTMEIFIDDAKYVIIHVKPP